MKPLISVIVPVFNVENYLKACIDSILKQTYQNIEIILINDGSTDNSANICNEYATNNEIIKVFHKINGGLSSARNMGIEKASGEFLAFIDSDDWIHENMLKTMLESAINSKAEIVSCNIALVDKDDQVKLYSNHSIDTVYSKTQALKLLYKNQHLNFSACNKLFKTELFHELRFTEGIIFEDMDLMYRLFNNANQIAYIHNPFYNYRHNSESILGKSFSLNRCDGYYINKKMYDFYREHFNDIADIVYYHTIFSTGCHLYTLICINLPDLADKYKFLIEFDKSILKRLVFSKYETKISWKNRLIVSAYLLSPKLVLKLKFYRMTLLK